MTLIRAIWDRLKQSGEIALSAREIGEDLGAPVDSVRDAIWRLRKDSGVIKLYAGRSSRYKLEKGAKYRRIGMGNHPNSRRQLTRWDWRKGLIAIAAKRGLQPKPVPTTELEKCWGFYGKQQMRDTLDTQTGEPCPKETKAAD